MYIENWVHKFEVKEGRWVFVPNERSLEIGKRIHKKIKSIWNYPLYMYHLRDGGHVAAANCHRGKKFFSLIDISNFFGSTSQSRITRALKTLIPYSKARDIAKLSTVRNLSNNGLKHVIPYGYPQSPILATLCFHQSFCGGVVNNISKSGYVMVSIYMDDILLSSNDINQLQNAFDTVIMALNKSGYSINEKKTQIPSSMVKVFNLELSFHSLRVSSQRMVEFIQAYIASENPAARKSIASYVGSINKQQAKLFN